MSLETAGAKRYVATLLFENLCMTDGGDVT